MREILVDTRKTGSGKTTDAMRIRTKDLEQRLGKRFRATFLLVPYGRQKGQFFNSDYFSGYAISTHEYISRSIFGDWNNDAIVADTYAGINAALKETDLDLTDCLIIMDELPTFLEFSCYQCQQSELLEYMLDTELYDSVTFYGMTGTPELLFSYCNDKRVELPFVFIDDTPQAETTLFAENGSFIIGGSANTYADLLIQSGFDSAKMFYVDSAKQAMTLRRKFIDAGYDAAAIVSEQNIDVDRDTRLEYNEIMRNQIYYGKSILDWIDCDSDIPQQLDVLIINAAARDGISIMDSHARIDEIVIQSADRMTIEQSRARIRHDIKQLTVIYSNKYENLYRSNLSEIVEWYKRYQESDNKELELELRYQKQIAATAEYQSYKQALSNAIRNNKPFNQTKPDVLDYVVLKSERGYFINRFAFAKAQYDVDNFLIQSKRQYVDSRTGAEITETKTYMRESKKYDDFKSYVAGIQHMCIHPFTILGGNTVRADMRNKKQLGDCDLRAWIGKRLFTDEKKRLAKQLSLFDEQRRVKGWTTAKNFLIENGYTITEDRAYVDGKQKRYAVISK